MRNNEDAVHPVEKKRCNGAITTIHLVLAGTAGDRPASVETGYTILAKGR
jgi:hypothetical protein